MFKAKRQFPLAAQEWKTRKAQPGKLRELFQKLLDPGAPFGAVKAALKEMREDMLLRDPKDFTRAISALGRRQMQSQALSLFEDMRRGGHRRNVITYSAAVDVCEKNRDWRTALSLLEQMEAEDVAPNIVTFNSAISACVKGNEGKKAFALFDKLKAQKVDPTVVTYSSLLAACRNSKLLERALDLKEQMLDTGSRGNVIVWSLLINVCEKCDEPQLAFKQFGEMKTAGFQPDPMTYNVLLRSCEKVGYWKRARELMDRMIRDGYQMDAEGYSYVIGACLKGFEPKMATDLFERMQEEGLRPTAATYMSAIVGYLRTDREEEALRLFERQKGQVIHVNEDTFPVIHALRKAGKYERVLEIFQDAVNANVNLSAGAYNDAVKACAETQQDHMITALVDDMRDKLLRPSGATYRLAITMHRKMKNKDVLRDMYPAAIRTCADSLQANRAVNLFGEMRSQNFEATADALNGVLVALEASGKAADSLRVFNRMRLDGHDADAKAYAAAMRACVQTSQCRSALQLLKEMQDASMALGHDGYKAALSAAAGDSAWNEALGLLANMQIEGIEADGDDYAAAMQACKRWDAVLDIYETMVGMHATPSRSALCLGIQAMVENRDRKSLLPAVGQLEVMEGERDEASYSALVRGFSATTRHRRALELFEDLTRLGYTPSTDVLQAALVSAKASRDKRKISSITAALKGRGTDKSASALPGAAAATGRPWAPKLDSDSLIVSLAAAGKHSEALGEIEDMLAQKEAPSTEEYKAAIYSAQAVNDQAKATKLRRILREVMAFGPKAAFQLHEG